MQLIERLHEGHRYMKAWPLHPVLAGRFPEERVIRATRFGLRWLPVVAMLGLAFQISAMGSEILPVALAQAMLIISIPLQGLYWLGWRSVQPLPLPVLNWCKEVRARLVEAGCEVAPLMPQSQYRHMACLLERAFRRLDDAFWCDH
ncbi:terminus macrodomain insulation protein YfbV [Ferrimonas marina]|uniref:UPF0208 membrane protein YfbV n=1 Tax=Ferrimonas marina TaxID=299255 RepID=A0A1M5SFT7_9GAMM|nr:terminus macrodomain insulation protein YfbV [Ferrimonas marina]SHH37404.1 hypothetical protein SAMN02745129_1987 [Ferrimonas marina]